MNLNIQFTPQLKFILILTGIAALSRLVPHEYNFSPIGAIALFAGTYIKDKKLSFILPLGILLISDILLELFYGTGFYRDMIFVYGAFAVIVGLGFTLRRRVQRQTIMVASLVSSLAFFFITNFGVWIMYPTYTHDLQGLINSYIAGIPFFRGTVMGDLFYNLILFGTYALARWKYPVLART
jgi:hypothetical protein